MTAPDQLAGDLLAVLEESRQPRPCKLCVALKQRSAEDRAALRQACASELAHEKLLTVLQKHGIPIGRPTLITHRREGHDTDD